jgi:hypothetical protein
MMMTTTMTIETTVTNEMTVVVMLTMTLQLLTLQERSRRTDLHSSSLWNAPKYFSVTTLRTGVNPSRRTK